LAYPRGAGHLWVFLNWALGLQALGCDVVWLEVVASSTSPRTTRQRAARLEEQLAQVGLDPRVVLVDEESASCRGRYNLDEAADADLLLNLRYRLPTAVMRRFRRTALVDIDPGLTQFWMKHGWLEVPPHDLYFTTGEGVSTSDRIPDVGVEWEQSRPCVALEQWPVTPVDPHGRFTTVTHWDARGEWIYLGDRLVGNSKRLGFRPYLDLPRMVEEPLELATRVGDDVVERRRLETRGWCITDPFQVAGTLDDYRRYVQNSLAEFSCTKPAYRLLRSAWVSDRTLCYLASGRAAVVQYTGESRDLPDAHGLFRFRDLDEAAIAVRKVRADPEAHGEAARALAEELFDARKVASDVLTRALV
jgi:hypothetical protein